MSGIRNAVLAPLLLAGLLLFFHPGTARAELWTYVGVITDIVFGSHPEIALTNVVAGQIEFDPFAPDTTPGSTQIGTYVGIENTMLVQGTTAWHLSTGSVAINIEISDNVPVAAEFLDRVLVDTNSVDMPTIGNMTITPTTITLATQESTAPTVLTSDALPVTPPLLEDFTTQRRLSSLGYYTLPTNGVVSFTTTILAFGLAGSGPLVPVLPTSQTINIDGTITWTFSNGASLCVSGCWTDPPLADSFTYEISGAGLFTSIQDFPTGYAQDFEVIVNSTSLGTFGPTESVDFTGFPGGGVTSFMVAGINPIVDAESPLGFPLNIALDSASTQFTMTSGEPAQVPISGTAGRVVLFSLLLGCGLLSLAFTWSRNHGGVASGL